MEIIVLIRNNWSRLDSCILNNSESDLILIFGVLMPLSTIFQLYHGDQF